MNIPYLALVVAAVCAVTFYRIGRYEKSSGALWAVLSAGLSCLALRFLPWGLGGLFLSQVILFAGITLFRVLSDR